MLMCLDKWCTKGKGKVVPVHSIKGSGVELSDKKKKRLFEAKSKE
jgi:hypothetical protein